jgi:hypothetical protein
VSAPASTDWGALEALRNIEEQEPLCGSCSETRAEADELRAKLAKAHALLRSIHRMEPKPLKRESLDEEPGDLEVIAHAIYVAHVRARIGCFLIAQGAKL